HLAGTAFALNDQISSIGRQWGELGSPIAERWSMANQNLATYLNDHLAGSVAALELLEYLEKTETGKAMGRFVPELRADIAADRRELGAPMARPALPASPSRAAAAPLAGPKPRNKPRLGR